MYVDDNNMNNIRIIETKYKLYLIEEAKSKSSRWYYLDTWEIDKKKDSIIYSRKDKEVSMNVEIDKKDFKIKILAWNNIKYRDYIKKRLNEYGIDLKNIK